MTKNKTQLSALLAATAAAIIYGGWAIYANFEHGAHAWGMAGIVQATYAFVSTLTITHIAHWVFLKSNGGLRGVITGFIASFIVMAAIPVTIHNIAATPDILQTILPGLIWGSGYLLAFLIATHKNHQKHVTNAHNDQNIQT
jgi:hypothetical protein